MVAVDVVLRYFHRLQLLQSCFLGYFVFSVVSIVLQMAYIGDVAYIAYLISQMGKVAEKQIESNGRTCMSQMRVTVNGRTADIHTYMWSVQWHE